MTLRMMLGRLLVWRSIVSRFQQIIILRHIHISWDRRVHSRFTTMLSTRVNNTYTTFRKSITWRTNASKKNARRSRTHVNLSVSSSTGRSKSRIWSPYTRLSLRRRTIWKMWLSFPSKCSQIATGSHILSTRRNFTTSLISAQKKPMRCST